MRCLHYKWMHKQFESFHPISFDTVPLGFSFSVVTSILPIAFDFMILIWMLLHDFAVYQGYKCKRNHGKIIYVCAGHVKTAWPWRFSKNNKEIYLIYYLIYTMYSTQEFQIFEKKIGQHLVNGAYLFLRYTN